LKNAGEARGVFDQEWVLQRDSLCLLTREREREREIVCVVKVSKTTCSGRA